MSDEKNNTEIVRQVFAAFGAGDVATLFGLLAEDIVWYIPGPAEVPFAGERRGHEGMRQFLQALGGSVEFEQFEPREFVAQGDKVIALGSERGRVKSTGRVYENPWALVFTVRGGRVAELRSYEDTAAVAEAFRAG